MKPNSNNIYLEVFNRLKENKFVIGNTTSKERIAKLKALKYAIEKTYRKKIQEALYNDFKKPTIETDLTEIYPVISEIKYTIMHLKTWMQKQKVATPLVLIGSKSYIKYEPKGVCLIISPWNFPLNLTFEPLVSAIAAGNTVIIKPSEITPHISAVMNEIISAIFSKNEIVLFEGDIEVSTELLKLPFNHIFFTGSPNVGKIVMSAAAKNLTSVTLELGGKSPTIIDESANLKQAAKKITWGKFTNNGQICVSPDYVLIQEKVKDNFIAEIKKQLILFYDNNPENSSSYCRIVSKKHFNRLEKHILNAKNLGATIEVGGVVNALSNYIAPTIISNIPNEATILQEEIFGPILPIITYKHLNEAINYINTKEKPLALYIFSKRNNVINTIISNTRAGSTCINHNVIQYTNTNLPFGGTNNSGIGKSHGFYGFQEFSNQRSFLKQYTKSSIEFLFPPYTKLKQDLIDLTIKWF